MTKRILGAACLCAAMVVFTGCPKDDEEAGKDAGTTCTPQCTGKTCGDNGCGGTCGTCAANQTCENGQCQCVPDCEGKVCGDDGCGGTCSPGCSANQECTAEGTCQIKICIPDCTNKDCGEDGCGGFCGSNRGGCPEGKACSVYSKCELCSAQCAADQECGLDANKCSCGSCKAGLECGADNKCVTCTPKCDGKSCGDDGCGGSCGTCASGTGCTAEGSCVACVPGAECAGKACGTDAKGCSCGTCASGDFCQRDGTCDKCEDTGGSVTLDTLCEKLDGGLKKWAAWNYQMCGMAIDDADPAQLNTVDIGHLDAEFFSYSSYGYVYPVDPYDQVHTCQYWLKDGYEAVKASKQAGHICFDSKAVDDCIQAGVDAKAQYQFGSADPALCSTSKFFVAQQKENDACSYAWECQAGTYCKPTDTTVSCGGVCTPDLAVGAPCVDGVDACQAGSVCSEDSSGAYTCVALAGLGEACTEVDCKPEYVCDVDTSGTCIEFAASGATCIITDSYYGDSNCVSGTYCLDDGTGALTCQPPKGLGDACDDATPCGDCMFCNPDTSRCERATKIGESCLNIQSTDMCVDVFGLQECEASSKTCIIKPREGATCLVDTSDPATYYTWSQGDCMYVFDNWCKRTGATEPGTCTALPKKGEPCGDNYDRIPYCQDGYCQGYTAADTTTGSGAVDGTCVDYDADGTACQLQADPGSGGACTAATVDDDCYSGEECVGGVCVVPACATTADCPEGELCDATVCKVAVTDYCNSSLCVIDSVTSAVTCGSPGAIGSPCAAGADGYYYCVDGAYCALDSASSTYLCYAQKAGGEPCEDESQCATGVCNDQQVCAYDCAYQPGSNTDGCGDYTGFNWWSKFIFVSGTLVFFGLRRRRQPRQ